MASSITVVSVLGTCLAAWAIYHVVGRLLWRRFPPPPGPHGLPLIGNLLDFSTQAPYKVFGAMSKKYGPIISLNMMGQCYIVLNSRKAITDLLEKRSSTTSNRPHLTMASDLVGWGSATAFLQYDDTHRKHRKFFHRQIGTKSSLQTFYPAEEQEAKRFLRNIFKNPDDLAAHSQRMAGSVILKISHGYCVKGDDDPFVEMANKAMRNFSMVTIPGRFLVDSLPILRYLPEWFPGCGFHKDAKRWRRMVNEAADVPHNFVLEQLAKGDAAPSLTSRLLQEGVSPEDEEILKWASFAMYLGGSDTTPATLIAFFLAMTKYPEVFKKAQAEVDAIVGHERLPTMEDRDALPYVNALCMELLRWNVVVPMVMHVSTQDIVYEGCFIPKGACLLGNIWSVLSDPETYPDPEIFNPERFRGEHPQLDPREVCFGWGRRMCPGAHLVDVSVFICVVTALATSDISKAVENGVVCEPRHEVEEGPVCHVKPFKCRIVPRSKKSLELLEP